MEPLQNGHDPPLGAHESPIHHQQPQNTVGPALEGGDDTVPSPSDPSPQGANAVPSTVVAASMTFPNCGHVIGGDLFNDFLTSPHPDCPVCQQGAFPGILTFGSCGHTVIGDALRRVLKSSTKQCPVCIPPSSNDSVATDAHSDPTSPTPTDIYTERSRVTRPNYRDPFTFEGVTPVMFLNRYGRPRFVVEEEVWNTWSEKEKDLFTYCTNVRLEKYVGESQQAPTNPGNPNHPNYTPTSTASVLRRNQRRKHEPEKVAEAIRRLLATPDQDVVPGKSYLRPLNGAEAQVAAPLPINQPANEEGDAVDVINDQPQELAITPGDGKEEARRPTFMDRVREQVQKIVGTWDYVLAHVSQFPSTSTDQVASEDPATGDARI